MRARLRRLDTLLPEYQRLASQLYDTLRVRAAGRPEGGGPGGRSSGPGPVCGGMAHCSGDACPPPTLLAATRMRALCAQVTSLDDVLPAVKKLARAAGGP